MSAAIIAVVNWFGDFYVGGRKLKTLKVLMYIVLAFTLVAMTGVLLFYLVVPEVRENLTLEAYAIPQKKVDRHTILVVVELVAMIVCSVASLISTIVNRKKPHGGYYAGAFLSVVLVGSASNILQYMEANYYNFYPVFRYVHVMMLKVLAWVLFITMAVLLLDGFLQTRSHKRAENKSPVNDSVVAAPVLQPTPGAIPSTAATELKQYKELLDMGGITQEEYEAKKKQLLGLPATYGAPVAPQNVGKCNVCGRENVPIESIEVMVAGMSRKRTMCAECAAKYK